MRTRFSTRQLAALFFLLIMLADVLTPTVAYALTAGPTAPEATSFEPVDTTDMVNPATGDFTYSLPLLEVPGPAGGYPLALSYHGGIMPDEEASWVGLGWTLNPGAINRSVNGYADDQFNSLISNRFFWEGGTRISAEVGYTVGISGVAGVTGKLAFSHDTYQGFGPSGVSASIFAGKSDFGAYAELGAGPGGHYASVGVRAGIGYASTASLDIGLSTNFSEGSFSGHVGLSASGLSVGSSISSNKKGFSNSVSVGWGSVHNSKVDKVSTQGFSFTPPLPFVHLSFNYQRYWIDETENVYVSGALYNPRASGSYDTQGYDSYTLSDPAIGLTENVDTDKVLGGSFLNYDNYSVSAQGLGGAIRPFAYKDLIFRQNKKRGDAYDVKQYEYGTGYREPVSVKFRFLGDFSNQYRNTGGSLITGSSPLMPDFGEDQKTGEAGTANGGIENGYLKGSKHIEWYTNDQILGNDASLNPFQRGFMNCSASGFSRPSGGTVGKQIGGFKIHNESGVVYHFALPAYSLTEYQYQENINRASGQTFNELTRNEKYAYTWYLTAVTGADYVDRGPNGLSDGKFNDYDWGYWVEFEYGLWTNSYVWRNPAIGLEKDIDNNFQNFSAGTKEVYYLDAIRTRTHTAIFFKNIREDSKGMARGFKDRQGGFIPKSRVIGCSDQWGAVGQATVIDRPVSQLRLDSIFLFDNRDLPSLKKDAPTPFSNFFGYPWNWTSMPDPAYVQNSTCLNTYGTNPVLVGQGGQHYPSSVYDVYDLQTIPSNIRSRALRKIAFKHDYSLVPETPNSFPFELINVISPSLNEADYPLLGKLTLNQISIFGRDNHSLIPPIRFEYDLRHPLQGSSQISSVAGSPGRYFLAAGGSGLAVGEILKINSQGRSCFALINGINTNGQFELRIVGRQLPQNSGFVSWSVTKNPPYNKDMHDMWGLYKPDFVPQQQKKYEYQFTTDLSARSLDVWTLRAIQKPTGSVVNLDFEPDDYVRASLFDGRPYNISIMYADNQGYRVRFFEPIELTRQEFQVGDTLNFVGLVQNEAGASASIINDVLRIKNVSEVTINGRLQTELLVGCVNGLSNCAIFERYIYGIYAGFMSVPNSDKIPRPGGGIRVKSISVRSGETHLETLYEYKDGATSFEPGFSPVPTYTANYSWDSPSFSNVLEKRKLFEREVLSKFSRLLQVSREVPAPGVVYRSVIVREKSNGQFIPGQSVYEFFTFDDNLIRLDYSTEEQVNTNATVQSINYKKLRKRNLTLSNLSAMVGQLKKVYLVDGGGYKISETVNHYLHDEVDFSQGTFHADYANLIQARFNSQGVIHETLMDGRFTKQKNGDFHLYGMVSRKHFYPSVMIGQTIYDHKTGIVTLSSTRAFDFYSGDATRIVTNDANGNYFLTEKVPAYRIYSMMGTASSQGKNMLSQEAQVTTYKVANSTDLSPTAVVSSSVQLWSDQIPVLGSGSLGTTGPQSGVWRKKSNYVFIGNSEQAMAANGLIAASSFTPFTNWTTGEPPSQWQKTSEVTLYDPNSHAIEAKDINENFAATKFTSDHSQVIASAANARYTEFAYCGGEENTTSAGGGVTVNGTRVPTAHTGLFGVQAAVNSRAFSFTLTPTVRDYVVNVWATQPDAFVRFKVGTVTSTATTQRLGKAGNWHLLQATLTATSTQPIEVWVEAKGATTQFDDFRVHPLTGPMTSYVYNSFGELSHILDASNLFTEFRYDAMGRLTQTYRETLLGPGDQPRYGANGIAKVSDIQYNYGKNSPYQVNLTVSQTGGSGSVSPIGSVPVEQGETQTIRIQESCAAPQVRWVYVDNVQYPTNASFTLFDGCSVSITPGSVRLANVRAPHEIRVEFNTFMSDAGYRCHMINVGGGQQCPSGLFEYGTRDQCGNITWVQSSWRGPGNAPNCCDLQPSGSNCHCGQVEN
ncbi:MAG: hypothetical protein ACK5OO_06315 [Cyclobacteriaceae bacterium]